MTTATAKPRKPRQKPERRITLVLPLNADGKSGLLEIHVGKTVDHYFVDRLAADFGIGFALEKCNHDGHDCTYHVNLNGRESICSCPGFLHHAKPCKHLAGLEALHAAGKL